MERDQSVDSKSGKITFFEFLDAGSDADSNFSSLWPDGSEDFLRIIFLGIWLQAMTVELKFLK